MNGQHSFQDEYSDDDEEEGELYSQELPTRRRPNQEEDLDTEAAAVARNIQLEAQKQFYIKFAQFILAMTVFFFLVLFSDMKNGSPFLILLTVLFGAYLLYMLGSLIMSIFIQNQLLQPGILTEGDTNAYHNNEQEEEEEQEERWQSYTFEETPHQIRKCPAKVGFSHPTNGLYKIVYSAIYFGKTIRTEAQLDLKFLPNKNGNGWEIRGTSLSGNHKASNEANRVVSEGFVNARGEMYWKLANADEVEREEMICIYRGLLDFQSDSMFDGEFEGLKVPRGRIVRMELMIADPSSQNSNSAADKSNGASSTRPRGNSWGDADVEMVEMGKGWD